jgi:uncharacterized membrane protein YbhN (UPF0104 family)
MQAWYEDLEPNGTPLLADSLSCCPMSARILTSDLRKLTSVVYLEISIRMDSPAHHDDVTVKRANLPAWRNAHVRTACQVAGLVALIAVMVAAGAAILPEALPNLVQAMRQNPFAPVLVAACWLIATAAAITGKRILACGHLCWFGTTTAHITGTVANRVVPAGVGSAGAYIFALRRGGVSTTAAAGAVALWAAAGGLAHANGLVLGLAWLHGGIFALVGAILAVAVAVATGPTVVRRVRAIAAGLPLPWRPPGWLTRWYGRPAVKRAVHDRARLARRTVSDALVMVRTRPLVAVAVLAAQLVAMMCLAVGFATAVVSLGVPVTAAAGVAAYTAGTALSATIPTPAGIGSSEAALVGALVVAGATVGEALPAVLLFRAVILLAPVIAAVFVFTTWPTRRGRSVAAGVSVAAPRYPAAARAKG